MSTVQTVNGVISSDKLGMTLTHEHIFLNLTYYWSGEPKETSKRKLYSQPVTLENRAEVLYAPWAFKDDTILDDMDNAINDVKAFIGFGGKSIVDVTASESMGRDSGALRYVSSITGANIIMSSGRYSELSMTTEMKKMSVDDVKNVILDEFINGVGLTGIKPGVIKVACNDLSNEVEVTSLRAGARAQKEIGCAMYIHPVIWNFKDNELLDIVEQEGGDPHRIIFAHQDFTGQDPEYHSSIAKRGAYIEFDTFGCECACDPFDPNLFFRSDGQKIEYIQKQIALGNIDHILMSGDMCLKVFLSKWGGWGYSHIPKHILPRMRGIGITEEQILRITVENPKRVLGH